MAQLTGEQVLRLAWQVGVPNVWLVTATAIAWAESGLRTDAVGINPGPQPGTVASRDRGLWQINDYYHPDVTDTCAFDATCNAQAMFRISQGGLIWTPWATYNNGAYQQYVPAAQAAYHFVVEGAGGGISPDPSNAGMGVTTNPGDATAAEIRLGASPLAATARLLQRMVDQTMDYKYGPGNRTGDIFGGFIQ